MCRRHEVGSDGAMSCEDSPLHVSTGECAVLARCKFKPVFPDDSMSTNVQLPIYECLTPLRCVLAKKFSRQNFEVMMKMEQHTEQRKEDPFYLSTFDIFIL